MYPTEPLRLCQVGCPVVHYDNCPDCLGFGIYAPTAQYPGTPVSAGEAMGGRLLRKAVTCPTCKSTIAGIPKEEQP
jgi:hypothetical protein